MGNATTKRHYSKSISLASSSKRPRWDGPGLPAPPGKPILIPGTDDTQPDVVGIRWERSPSNGGSAIVGYLVEHRRMGSAHWVRSKPGLCTFPELTLSGLEPGWRYQFRVRAQNAVGLSAPSELSDPLTVTLQRAAASAPLFDLELSDLIALENEQAEFVVRFTGTPLPKISWFKDGFEIFSSRRTRILTENGKSVLLIHQTALNDEGEIKCTATNRAGHVSTKARLILEAFPKIRLPRQYEDGLLFEQDETIRLKVSLAGRPPPTVAWFHDGEPLSQDTRHLFETMDGESVLKIPDAKRFDRGEYTVKARNKLGEDSSSFLVTVTDRPAAPGKVNVTMTLGRSVTLSWKEPEDDGGCKIGTYIVEYYRIGWEVWLKATTSRQTAATLTELLEGSEYRFRVKAENPYGVSDPSEESDIIFIPDLNKGATSPQLTGKSQSQREISRSRGDKREVSFIEPAPRSRSLTREEAGTNGQSPFGGRSSSAQRLSMERSSRVDSRVTFGPDTTIHVERTVPPVPPARSRDHSRYENRSESRTIRQDITSGKINNESQEGSEIKKRATSPTVSVAVETKKRPTSPTSYDNIETAISVSPRIDSIGRPSSLSRERSLSPLSLSLTRENLEEKGNGSRSPLLRPISILKKQNGLTDDADAMQLTASPRENNDILHDSSEFMLVLYPKDEAENKEDNKGLGLTGRDTTEVLEDEKDLVPPPMSLSLPELFSREHEVIEIMREAVSSTEMLHERAMERFYKAMEAEKESEGAKRKEELERKTGELASIVRQDLEMGGAWKTMKTSSALRRKLSNSGDGTVQNLISSWQAKKTRRRLSEGQVEGVYKPMKLLSPLLLPDVEARSDPNLPTVEETITARPWRRSSDEEGAERLRRWHETNVPLLEETLVEKSIGLGVDSGVDSTNRTISPFQEVASDKQEDERVQEEEERMEEEEEEEESVETSEESSEEMSSADSEDLKNLKQRILSRQVMEEEDTYHPRGRPIPHFDSFDKPHFTEYGFEASIANDSTVPSIWIQPPLSPTNVQPKSILKKPKEDGTLRTNEFGKAVPPDKPIRKVPPVRQEEASNPRELNLADTSEYYDTMKPGVMSESDTDSVLSAGEAAKNRRIQAKMRSATPEEETSNEADVEARMAVVSHYTEIVREHSSSHSTRIQEEGTSRRGSFSEYRRNEGPSKNKVSDIMTSKQIRGNEEASSGGEAIGRRKNSVGSRGTTPSRDTRSLVKERRESRASSRTRSPSSRSRNVSVERGTNSRSSSKSRVRDLSRERNDRPGSRTTSEERGFAKERSVDRSSRNTKGTSRSSSRDRQRATTPAELKIERLQRALESKKYRAQNRIRSDIDKYYPDSSSTDRANDKRLALQARKTVKSTVNYITDLTLLMAAVYVYLFKKETMAIPFIALLLYRRIQEGIRERISGRWWSSKRKH